MNNVGPTSHAHGPTQDTREAIAPAMLSDSPSAFLEGSGVTTNPVYVQDLALWLPLIVMGLGGCGRADRWVSSSSVRCSYCCCWKVSASPPTSGSVPWRTQTPRSLRWRRFPLFLALAIVGAVPLFFYMRHLDAAGGRAPTRPHGPHDRSSRCQRLAAGRRGEPRARPRGPGECLPHRRVARPRAASSVPTASPTWLHFAPPWVSGSPRCRSFAGSRWRPVGDTAGRRRRRTSMITSDSSTPWQGLAGLERLCGELMSVPLPQDRPMWELLLVPGASVDGVGVVLRIHHALADGIAAVAIAQQLFDPSEGRNSRTARPGRMREHRAGRGAGNVLGQSQLQSAPHPDDAQRRVRSGPPCCWGSAARTAVSPSSPPTWLRSRSTRGRWAPR